MAHRVSKHEDEVVGFSLGSTTRTKRARKALSQLGELAAQGPKIADEAADLLESAVAVLTERRVPAAIPARERGQWEALGARFDDGAAPNLARLHSRAKFQDLVSQSVAGDAAAASLLGVDRSRVSQRVSERSLYAFTAGDTRLFPTWQFDGPKTLPHLRQVLTALASDLHPLVVHHWFTTPNLELSLDGLEPLSPADWLATGGPAETVVGLATHE